MAVNKEIWVDYILGKLFKDNSFYTKAFKESDHVLGGAVVHIPQAGAAPVVRKNRSTFPAVAVQRADTDVVYPLDSYSIDPTFITDAEQAEISYSKMDSVLGEHLNEIRDVMGDDYAIKWLSGAVAAGNIYQTTGATTDNLEDDQTGSRKILMPKDLKNLQAKMNKAKIGKEDRYAVLESNMLDQLTDSMTVNQERDYSRYYNAETGVLGKLHGFNIMERSDVGIVNTGNTAVNALGSAILADDNVASLVFQKHAVAYAEGSVDFYDDKGNPLYYGDIYSAAARAGGRVRRANAAGVYALVQGA